MIEILDNVREEKKPYVRNILRVLTRRVNDIRERTYLRELEWAASHIKDFKNSKEDNLKKAVLLTGSNEDAQHLLELIEKVDEIGFSEEKEIKWIKRNGGKFKKP